MPGVTDKDGVKMFSLGESDKLTAFNGTEETRCPELFIIAAGTVDMCCGRKYEDKHSGVKCKLEAEVKDEEFTYLQSRLLLGDPFKMSQKDGEKEDDWEWTPIPYLTALDKAEKMIEEEGLTLRQFLMMELPTEEDNLYVAISLLRLFIQLNFTGPEISMESVAFLQLTAKFCRADIEAELEVDGIEVEHGLKGTVLLPLASHFLRYANLQKLGWPAYLIWRFRILYLHQRALSRRSMSLCTMMKYLADLYINWMQNEDHYQLISGTLLAEAHGSFLCEIAEMLVYYYDSLLADKLLEQATKALGVMVEFTGKMGFRTKFQQTATPQTVLNVEMDYTRQASKDRKDVFRDRHPSADQSLPASVALDDDTRLDRIRLVDDDEKELPKYKDVHQLILLGKLMRRRGYQDAQQLKREEEEALVNGIIDCPVSWSGRVAALLARSDMEKFDKRAVGRALQQLHELSKQINRDDVTPNLAMFRQYLFFGSGHPLKKEVKLQLGEIFMAMCHWKEALTVFKELNAFEQIVRCYQMQELPHKAEEMVREQLKQGKTAKLLVLLGDVTRDIEQYKEAWTLSEFKSIDSQIRLGSYYFKREQYSEAIEHLEQVVKLGPLEYPAWLQLAWACYRKEDYEKAFSAYLRAVNLEYDNFQVWNNLANCALKLNKKEYALRAYKNAVKCSYDEWRVWSNILCVAADLNAINDGVAAYHRILELNNRFTDDVSLEKMVSFAINKDHGQKPKAAVLASLAKLFGRIIATVNQSRSYLVPLLYGRVLTAFMDCEDPDCDEAVKLANFERALPQYEKSFHLMRSNNWKSDLSLLNNVVQCLIEIRKYRERGQDILPKQANDRMTGPDTMRFYAVKNVFQVVNDLMKDLPDNETIQAIYDEMQQEMHNPFYPVSY